MKEEYMALKAFFTEPDQHTKKTRVRRKGTTEATGTTETTEATGTTETTETTEATGTTGTTESFDRTHTTETNAEEIPFPENPKVIANTKIRIIKRGAEAPAPQAPAPQVPAATDTRMNSKDLKAWQKEQEAKTLEALTAKGILPESLLTLENIKKWIEDEHRTFAYVAREHLGMPEAKVADFAKEHGIKSTISKKRAILSAKNRVLN
jgi:hypothetical protein